MNLQALPKISVIIPAFNEEKYIERVLDALMIQDYPNFEIIVCDNHSTDLTMQVVLRFIERLTVKSFRLVLVHEERQGTNFARECARKKATGTVIAQVDADCIPSTDWLSKGIAQLCRGKRVAVTGPYDYFDGSKNMRTWSLLLQRLLYPLTNMLTQLTGRAAILIGGNAFIRAEILGHAGGYNTSLTFYGDDVDMGKRLCRFGKVVYSNTLLQRSSSRRYKANGFWEVNKKYQSSFWNLVWNRNILATTTEISHPR
jgi:glycosyltransferase involved in cell wall biosynthesis